MSSKSPRVEEPKVYGWSRIFSSRALNADEQSVIRKLLLGFSKSAGFERLHGPGRIYSARINREKRLLFNLNSG